jgi:hypothetical protein
MNELIIVAVDMVPYNAITYIKIAPKQVHLMWHWFYMDDQEVSFSIKSVVALEDPSQRWRVVGEAPAPMISINTSYQLNTKLAGQIWPSIKEPSPNPHLPQNKTIEFCH